MKNFGFLLTLIFIDVSIGERFDYYYEVATQIDQNSDQNLVSKLLGSTPCTTHEEAAVFTYYDQTYMLVTCVPTGTKNNQFFLTNVSFDQNGLPNSTQPNNKFMYPVNRTLDPSDIKDPRITLDNETKTYYLFYVNECEGTGMSNSISLTTFTDPLNLSSWIQYGNSWWTSPDAICNNTVLIKSQENGLRDNYLFFGDENIAYTVSPNMTAWPNGIVKKNIASPNLNCNNSCFDRDYIWPGPSPLRLSSGDFFFLYNAKLQKSSSVGLYFVGFMILDGNNPTQIKQRSDSPITTEQMYTSGMIPHPKGCSANLKLGANFSQHYECFWAPYWTNDSNIRSVSIIVGYNITNTTGTTTTQAPIVGFNPTSFYGKTISKHLIIWISASAVVLLAAIFITIVILLFRYQKKKNDRKLEQMVEAFRNLNLSPKEIEEINKKKDELLINRKNLEIDFNNIIGKGVTSIVYKGYLNGFSPLMNLTENIKCQQFQNCEVAIKKITSNFVQQDASQIIQEIDVIKRLGYNEYIVCMLGWCINKDAYCLVFELASTNLLSFVKSLNDGTTEMIALRNFVSYLWQIANGMNFIASHKMVHRDLAARNILLIDDDKAKISDFGLMCDCDQDTLTYQATLNKRLPVRWLSVEALDEKCFSEKSDVWSFGVLMYEMLSLGKYPYAKLENHEILQFLRDGNRLNCPDNVPEEISSIMHSCWEERPEKRPNFSYLINYFRDMLEISSESYGYVGIRRIHAFTIEN